MEYSEVFMNNLLLGILFLYASSLMYYQYFFAKEVGNINNFLSLSFVEQIKVVFLAIIGILPFVNTIMCLLIGAYQFKKYRESKFNKYE